MKFTVLINPGQNWPDSVNHAFKLAQSITQSKHKLLSIFFYGEAVKIASFPNLQTNWKHLKQSQAFDLFLCRTMIELYEIPPSKSSDFQIVGMGQLTKAMENADKVIEVV